VQPTGFPDASSVSDALFTLHASFRYKMKDPNLGNAENSHLQATLQPSKPRQSCLLAFPSCGFRLKKKLLKSTPPLKPAARVFMPLSLEDRKHLEALFPALMEVERRLEVAIIPGHPSELSTAAPVQLQPSCQTSSLWQRRRPAPVVV